MITIGNVAYAAANGRFATELPVHDVAEELRGAADDLVHVEVAERQREREDRARDDRRPELRQHDLSERAPGLGAEVGRGFEQRVR